MTAINAAVLAEEAHLFTDAGHYDPDSLVLRSIGGKAHRLSCLPAIIAFTGPSRGAEAIRRAMEGRDSECLSAAFAAFPGAVLRAVEETRIEERYSALLLGADGGLVVQEGGRLTPLYPGRVIKSLPSPIQFDPDNIASSGLAMMIDQRARHKVVSGYCQHTVIRPEGIASRILHCWPDQPVLADGDTIAAKIADLTVDTLNIAPNAVTGVASATSNGANSFSVTVPNPLNFPIKIIGTAAVTYTGTNSTSEASVTIKLSRGSTTLYQFTQNYGGNGTESDFVNAAFCDQVSGSQTYTMTITTTGQNSGVASVGATKLIGLYTKK